MKTCGCCGGLVPDNWLDIKDRAADDCDGSVDAATGRCRSWLDDDLSDGEDDEAEFSVQDCWPQIDGGVRYLVSGPGGVEVTVDKDKNGKLFGFVRGSNRDDEDDLLRRAWDAVKSSDDDLWREDSDE